MLLHRLPTEHSFALLDQLSVDDLPAELHADPVIPRGLENASHLMPLMIDLRALAEVQHSALVDWLEASLQRCGESPIACWLKTQASPTRIRSHLAARLVVRSGNGERCLLRYYDPKVFAHLRWILNAAQLGELFGPVSGWTCWLDGGWRHVNPPPPSAGRAPAFDAQQGEHLRRVAAINALLAELPASPDADAFERSARRLSGYIARAQRYGWRDERDWLSFGRLCLACHPDFDAHPEIRRLIERLADDEIGFADAAALLEAASLKEIADELNAASTNQMSTGR